MKRESDRDVGENWRDRKEREDVREWIEGRNRDVLRGGREGRIFHALDELISV